MSAGRSSQVCGLLLRVERTKYLMLSKWMPDRSEPHEGIGLRSNMPSAFSRSCSIQSGSLFFEEMSRTTASERPRWALAPASSESCQPNW